MGEGRGVLGGGGGGCKCWGVWWGRGGRRWGCWGFGSGFEGGGGLKRRGLGGRGGGSASGVSGASEASVHYLVSIKVFKTLQPSPPPFSQLTSRLGIGYSFFKSTLLPSAFKPFKYISRASKLEVRDFAMVLEGA